MPLDEEGAKWSCEPCIRGHRSSKCQHFDRLMMKVPKAGRPLQKCPHPKGTCSCQKLYAFMVRIPKGSTCLCRPLYKVPATASETEQQQPQQQPQLPSSSTVAVTTTMPLSPVTPATPSASANRIQKRSRRQNSIQASVDSVSRGLGMLESPVPVKKESSTPTVPKVDGSTMVENEGPESGTYQKTNGSPTSTVAPALQNGGCCGSKGQPKNHQGNIQKAPGYELPHHTLQPQQIQPKLLQKQFTTPSTASEPASTPAPLLLNSLNSEYAQYAPSSQTVPTTTFSSPGKNQQHQQPQQQFSSFDQFGSSGSLALGLPASFSPAMSQVGCKGHNCGCGDGCQCLGCASHPYNDTTRHYIQEMGYMIASGYGDQGTEGTDEVQSPTYSARVPPEPHLAGFGQSHFSQGYAHTAPFQPHIFGYGDSSSIPATMSQNTSDGELMMSPTAYYTVEYPISMLNSCTNISGTCQCTMNCTCVGCLMHQGHNGISTESSPPPDLPQVTSPNDNTPEPISFYSTQTQTPLLTQMQIQAGAQAHLQAQVPVSNGYNIHYPSHTAVESPPV
ncbi:hypothetical protein MaudMau93_003130 [Microsporum audouinii]